MFVKLEALDFMYAADNKYEVMESFYDAQTSLVLEFRGDEKKKKFWKIDLIY